VKRKPLTEEQQSLVNTLLVALHNRDRIATEWWIACYALHHPELREA